MAAHLMRTDLFKLGSSEQYFSQEYYDKEREHYSNVLNPKEITYKSLGMGYD